MGIFNRRIRLIIYGAFLLLSISCILPSPISSVTPAPEPLPSRVVLTTTPPAPTVLPDTTPNPVPPKIRLAGYFYGLDAQDQLSDLAVDKLTSLIYAFVDVSPDGNCVSAAPALDQSNFTQLRLVKQRNPQLEILFSVGGYSRSAYFSNAALTPASRSQFASSCIQLMQQNGFDGIDIDWEVPVSGGAPGTIHRPKDKQNYTALIAELRRQMDESGGRHYLLSIATPAGPTEYANLELASIASYVDWINLETYAVAVAGGPITGFNAPLYRSSSGSIKDANQRQNDNADATVKAYLQAGVPAAKILLGVPFYGRGWSGVPDINHGLYQTHRAGEVADPGVPPGVWKSGSAIDFQDLETYYLGKYARYWDPEVMAAWLFDPATGIMISYEDPQALGIKADYVLKNRLGGMMIWQLSQDDRQHSLLDAIYSHLFH